jgi:hypothetical protein
MAVSMEADIIPLDNPDGSKANLIDDAIGEFSEFRDLRRRRRQTPLGQTCGVGGRRRACSSVGVTVRQESRCCGPWPSDARGETQEVPDQ